MWEVTLTARNPAEPQETAETTIRINSDDPADLLKNEHFRWTGLESLMERGFLSRVRVDYRPNASGERLIRRGDDGLFYVHLDGVQCGQGYVTPEDAWLKGWGQGCDR